MKKNTAAADAQPNFVALYRKYRPQAFDEVRGQDSIVKVLEGAIAAGNISHAYLFAGSRGTGKTSIARIFAHAIGTTDNDLYEIDAASNRGIDDIREIRDAVNVLPFESKYKVYIIDEVHMLTKEAFNALLKTLEEPPSHAIFILATTETEKIPETIISRCQVFAFRKPPVEVLREHIVTVAKREKIALEKGVADLIATLGDGSFRDALGTLQKVIAASGDESAGGTTITLAEAEQVTGAPKSELVLECIEALVARDAAKALPLVTTIVESGVSASVLVRLLLEKVRYALLLVHAPSMAATIRELISEREFDVLSKIAADKNPAHALGPMHLRALLKAAELTRTSPVESLPLELAVIEICTPAQAVAGK